MKFTATIFCVLTLAGGRLFAQHAPNPGGESPGEQKVELIDTIPSSTTGSERYVLLPVRASCKWNNVIRFMVTSEARASAIHEGGKGKPEKRPLVTLHGNILYDFDYWSNIDTPYAERNINQQTLQTYIDLSYKNEYPFRVYFTTVLTP